MAYSDKVRAAYQAQLKGIKDAGLFKQERFIHSPQAADIEVEFPSGSPLKKVINMCANNYLGLSSHPDVVKAAHEGLDSRGYGMSSVRFICGTQDIHRELEQRLTEFLGTEDTLLFPSCMDANAGVFEAILTKDDVIISDRLVHASLIDGIRLNNSTFRYGPNQYINTIDAYSIDRIEILRGFGSTLYGSDAVGGVLNFLSPSPGLAATACRSSGTTSRTAVAKATAMPAAGVSVLAVFPGRSCACSKPSLRWHRGTAAARRSSGARRTTPPAATRRCPTRSSSGSVGKRYSPSGRRARTSKTWTSASPPPRSC